MPLNNGQRARSVKRVDELVGHNIRTRRIFLGLTQEILAQALKISYQQVQKYEAGANRISTGRLYDISRVLDVEVGTLFEGLNQPPMAIRGSGRANRSTIEVAQNFSAIRDPDIRAAVANLIKCLRSDRN